MNFVDKELEKSVASLGEEFDTYASRRADASEDIKTLEDFLQLNKDRIGTGPGQFILPENLGHLFFAISPMQNSSTPRLLFSLDGKDWKPLIETKGFVRLAVHPYLRDYVEYIRNTLDNE